ncbi:MAG: hypothetical protein KAS66_01275 [Candidatus Omnitrophica bacterium]|nr:hypothetical protein [Candidatus Omnitrophota bacterium]
MRPELVLSGLIFLVFSLISILPINKDNLPEGLNLFTLFYHFPRFIWMFIFSLSYVVSLGLSEFEKNYFKHKNFIAKMIIYGLTLFILSDLILVNGPILKEAFSRPPENIERGAYFVQTNKEEVYDQSSMYPTILSNQGIGVDGLTLFQGTFSLCHAIPFGSERYRGEAYLEGGKKDDLRVVHFSPNSVKIKLLTKKTDMLLLNQNYDSNWRVKGLSDNKIISTDGLISVKVTPEDTNGIITFYYLSDKFLYGLVLSLLAFILIIFHIRGFIPASIFKYTLFCLTAIFVVFILIEFRGPVNKSQEWHSGYQHAIKGISAYRHKNYAEAKEEIRQAVEYFPNSVILHQRLKEFYTIEGQKEKALIEQELIDELLPD